MGRRGKGAGGAVLLVALAGLLAGAPAAMAAQLVAIEGREQRNFGRIALTFDRGVKVTAKLSGTVLVLSFREPAPVRAERLAAEMPAYVGQVRRDPDGSGLRLALQQPLKVNVLEAGERVFVDLLPETWSGLPPGLPPEIVADLARRAAEAEARLRQEARRGERPVPLRPEVAELPTLTRLSIPLPRGAEAHLDRAGPELRLRLPGAYVPELGDTLSRLRPRAVALDAEAGGGATRLTLTLADGYEAEGFRDDDAYTFDIVGKGPRRGVDAPAPAPALEAPTAPAGAPRIPAAPPARAAAPAPLPEPPAPAVPASGPVQARVSRSGDGLRIGFPFAVRPPAALFERGGVATLAFESPLLIRLDADALPGGSAARLLDVAREGGFAVLRFALAGGAVSQLVAGEGGGWDLVLGDGSAPGAVPLVPRRAADEAGKPAMAVPLPRPGGAFWLDRDGERIAVATALGPRAAGVAKRGRFVEFEILASRHGVAVLAGADDLVVRPGLDEVAITRAGGLAVSPVVADPLDAGAPVGAEALAVDTARWREDRRGHGLARLHDAAVAAATAERAARPAARVDYARALMANGLLAEAATVLATAFKDDPILAADRRSRVLAAIAAVLLGRDARAAELLGTDARAGQDPETRLWRAMLDARAGRGVAALAAFKASLPLIESYPEDLQSPLLLAGARTALDGRDPAFAQKLLTLAAPLAATPLARDEVAFLRNRFAEEIGQDEAAMREYRRLSDEGERPVAAEAALRLVDLGLAAGKLSRDEAIDRLERLALTWHGAPLEPASLARLGRLYAEAGRWRDAFAVARKANRFYPDDPATRDLHEATVALFAGLFLTDKGAGLGKVEALALYFDFKEFTPIGRQGDEIVRRLADRLVALDLLDAAGDLLQHQVDKRLAGAARAAVAAKLATIRLMDGRPLQALQVLQATRLPELPPSVRDARLLLEARALSDLSRTDLALEKLDGVDGPEAGRLRADALWAARRWREAGEAHETLVATRWREPGPLRDDERADVLRAAIAYALAEEAISLDRLRTKFMPKMAESADARAFALLSSPNAAGTAAFRDLARRAITADTLSGFLASYRARYPESAAPARPAATPAETPPPAAEASRGAGPPPG